MRNTEEFLTKEIENFHDVRPVIKGKSPEPKEIVFKKDQELKTLFSLSKSPEKEKKDETETKKEARRDKILLSQQVVENMEITDNLLKQEIEKYHDVRPIFKERREGEAPVKEVNIRESEDFLSVTKLVEKHTNDVPESTGISKIFKIIPEKKRESVVVESGKDFKPVLSEQVKLDIQNTNNFLKTEVDKFHDVRSIIKEKIPEPSLDQNKEKKEFKGILGIFKKRREKQGDSPNYPILSEEVLKDMKHTDSFLKEEIQKYHDVRPITNYEICKPSTKELREVSTKKESKGILGLFKKTPEKRASSTEKDQQPKLSEQTIADMLNSDNFLKTEVETYYDVRPIVEKKSTLETQEEKHLEKAPKEHKGILSMFKKSDDKKDFDKSQKSEFSGEVLKAMRDASTFLKEEVDNYHDVRPNIKSADLTNKLKEKVVSSIAENIETVPLPDASKESHEKKESSGLLGIFRKKKKHHKEPKKGAKLSQETINNMQNSLDFLKEEVYRFHDVRPVIGKTQEHKTKADEKPEEAREETTSIFYTDVHRNIPETTDFLRKDLDTYEDAYGAATMAVNETTRENIPSSISESVLLNMITTNNFLKEEVARYHDVKPVFQEQKEEVKEEAREKQSKGNKLFGLFGKRKSQERESSVDKEQENSKKDKKKKKSQKQDSKKESEPTEKQEPEAVSTSVSTGLVDSKNFLQSEIDRYHDVRPENKKQEGQNGGLFEEHLKKTKPKDQAKNKLDKPGDKSKESDVVETTEVKEAILDVNIPRKKISTVSQDRTEYGDKIVKVTKEMYIVDPKIMKDIADLDEDIKRKIAQAKADADSLDRDTSKPFVRETFSIESKIIDRIIPVSTDSETITETEIIYENVPATIIKDTYIAAKTPDPKFNLPPVDEAVLKDTNAFLEQEILQYHDVRPVIKKVLDETSQCKQTTILEKSKSEDLEAPQRFKKDRKKSGSPFRIFERKHKSEDQSVKLMEDDKENIKDSDREKQKEKKEKGEKRRSGGFFSMFSKSAEESSKIEQKQEFLTYSPEIIKTLQDTTNFLSTELVNYEDAKPVLVTDLDEDIEVEEHTKSGLFSIFSKKRESPKITKKLFKKHKRERSQEASDIAEKTYQKLEDLDEAVDKGLNNLKLQVTRESAVLEKDFKTVEDKTEDLAEDLKPKKVTFTETLTYDVIGDVKQIIKNEKEAAESIKAAVVDVTNISSREMEEKEKKEETILKLNKEVAEFNQFADIKSKEVNEVHKKDKGIFSKFSKLGDKTTGITEAKEKGVTDVKHIKERSAAVVDEIVDKAEKKADLKRESVELYIPSKESSSSFVNDMLQSFDSTMEHVKEDEEVIKTHSEVDQISKDTDELLKKFNDTCEETKQLSQELTNQSNNQFSKDFLINETKSIEKQRELTTKDSEEQLENNAVKDAKLKIEPGQSTDEIADLHLKKIIHESKKKSGFFGKLGDKITGKVKDVEKLTKHSLSSAEEEVGKIKADINDTEELTVNKLQQVESKLTNKGGVSDDIEKQSDFIEKTVLTGTDNDIQVDILNGKDKIGRNSEDLVRQGVEKAKDVTFDIDIGTKKHTVSTRQELDKHLTQTLLEVGETEKAGNEATEEAKKQTGGFFSKLGNKITGKAKKGDKLVEDRIGNVKESIDKTSSKTKDSIKDYANTSLNKVNDGALKIADSQNELAISTSDAGEITVNLLTNLDDKIDDKAKDTKTILKETTEHTKDEIQKIRTNLADILDKKGETAADVATRAENIFNDSQKAIDHTISSEHTKIDTTKADIKATFKETKKKTGGFLTKLGGKITGKTKDTEKLLDQTVDVTKEQLGVAHTNTEEYLANVEKEISEAFHEVDKSMESSKKKVSEISVKSVEHLPAGDPGDPSLFFDTQHKYLGDGKLHLGQIKQRTAEFLEAELSDTSFRQIPRTVSDYGGQVKEAESGRGSISEANIDLSNLPSNIDQHSQNESCAYVTSPVFARRVVSQKYSKGERPDVVEIRNIAEHDVVDVAKYTVTEPEEELPQKLVKTKPLFHIESEDDDSLDLLRKESYERSDSVRSNVLETLTEDAVDSLLSDLSKNLGNSLAMTNDIKVESKKDVEKIESLKEHIKDSQADVELIEQKLRDLDRALDSLEQAENTKTNLGTEQKLKRVERKFERMASELLEKENKEAKANQLSSPEVDEKRESEFRSLVSQISAEEVSDFQKEYSHLWDENTFSKSDDWESKTPDSQADVQELPKGSEHPQPSGSQQEASSHRVESEEAQEKANNKKSKKIPDQHQLSSEMKELLKEMEKESKQ